MKKATSFEISLVPAVKAKLLHQERVRNFVVFICILVAIGCGVLIAALFATRTALSVASSKLDNEIACRIGDGGGKNCSKYTGVPIMQTTNLNEMLSIQNELNTIGTLNKNKTKPSRLLPSSDKLVPDAGNTAQVYSMLEIALPTDAEYKFQTSEFEVDFDNSVLDYEVVAHAVNSNAQATAYINFKYSINGSYFDYGDYMRTDEDGNVSAIPSYCIISEKIVDGSIYGLYNRYAKGCEVPMVDTKEYDEDGKEIAKTYHEVDPIYIRRSYASAEDLEAYKTGSNRSDNIDIKAEGEAPQGFFFESKCIQYGADGKFDEAATLNTCPVATEEVEGEDKSEVTDEETGEHTISFKVSLPFTKEIFAQSSHNVVFFYPSRKTVSTSYRAIEDFFTKPIEETNAKEVE